MSLAPAPPPALPNRIVSLDQFRGYTIFGMFLVNYMSSYKDITPNILLHHHTYCSYADLIMPHFLFCVGFAFRLTFGRRDYKESPHKAHLRVIRRILGLMLVTFSVYHVRRPADAWADFIELNFLEVLLNAWKSPWTNTLGQIALTSLWILPWLRKSKRTRIIVMILSGIAHHVACHYFYFTWVNTSPNGVDGGPLGFLTWTIPALLGTIACDWVVDAREANPQRHAPLGKMLFWSIIVMLIGWFITFPSRAYDITPTEMAELKENEYRHRDKVNGLIGENNKPLNEKLKPFNKYFGDFKGDINNKDFEMKQSIVARMMTEQGLDPATDYPTEAINEAALNEWETKYAINYEGELGELHKKLDYYEEALEPEYKDLSDEQEQVKLNAARKYEEVLKAEYKRKEALRDSLMTEANLDPAKDQPTDEINKKIGEQFEAEPGEELTRLREELAALKPEYLEKVSPYYHSQQAAQAEVTPAAEGEEKKEATPQEQLASHLETLTEIDWNSIPNYKWRDLKLAEYPVAFDMERYMALPLSKKIGRNPMERPPYEDSKIVDYNPRDAFYWNAWMMSQRAGTVAYPTFAAGASLLMYLLFYIMCDKWGWQVPLFRTWGTNALAAYVLFELVCGAVKNFVPKDPTWWFGWGSLALGMFLMWVVIRNFEKNKIYIRM
ncbi:MAG: heparan-alpha-glucosaminide N-acetyltransferase domain-containing protein [Planctomycetaceae bacterium]